MQHNFGVIMAGGIGSRFWPMSTSGHPKQFLDILGTGKTLLQQSFERLAKVCDRDKIYIVTNEKYRELCLSQLPGIQSDQILCEPERKNTAPCIAYAYFKIQKRDPRGVMIITPSDHLISDENTFQKILKKSVEHGFDNNVLITIGIKPSRPDTGYGYIKFNKSDGDFNKVDTFTEKPNLEKAKAFLESGDYSWNSGMFIWNCNAIDAAFQKDLPGLHQLFSAKKDDFNSDRENAAIQDIYANCENISIDYGIMEKASNVDVINGDFGWSDIGTWGSLYEHIPTDSNQNAVIGANVVPINSNRNIIRSSGDKLIVLQGLDDFIVVEYENTILICKKEEEQKIKQIVERIEVEKGKEFV